ncbi:MAG: hypothetical protein LQ346_001396 [Caloplaca aetnensis]|nr:MAG: hypothetical protein LQ346_001396 [Caloplaca aetnensis]
MAVKGTAYESPNVDKKVPLTLDVLPVEIQRNIYASLLKADCVRQPPDQYLVRHYRFHTDIMSVNKRIHYIARSVLYKENSFIVVSCNWETFFTTMTNHEVAVVSSDRNHVARFRNHAMRLHIVFPWAYICGEHGNKEKSGVLESFVIVQEELSKFVRLLLILSLVNTGGMSPCKLTFRIEEPSTGALDQHVQKSLMEPFRRLTSLCHSVKILGPVDKAYALGLQEDMIFPIRWTRAVTWQLYDVMVSIAKVAEEAVQLENADMAVAKYNDCQKVYEIACQNNSRLDTSEDVGFYQSCAMLTDMCQANSILLALQDPSIHEPGSATTIVEQTDNLNAWNEPVVTPLARSKLLHYRGIGHAMVGKDGPALDCFRKAIRLDPQNQNLRRHTIIAKKRMTAKTRAEKLAAGTITADGLEPMAIPEPVYTPSQFIAGERHLLRRFNYKGDMLLHIEENAPADVKEMDKLFKGMEVQQKSTPPGKPWTAWIGAVDDDARTFRRTGLNPGMIPTPPGMDPTMGRMFTHILGTLGPQAMAKAGMAQPERVP